jgi:hypothetical protein
MPVPLPNIAGTYYSLIKGSYGGQPNGIVAAFQLFPAPSTGINDITASSVIATAIAANWVTFAADVYNDAYEGVEVLTYPLHTPTAPAFRSVASTPGGQTGDTSPAPVAAVIKHSILRRGRGSQSRTFISYFKDGWITPGGESLNSVNAGTITSAWDAFLTGVIGDPDVVDLGVLTFGQLSRVGSGAFHPSLGSSCETLLSTQRSRTARG